MNDSLTINRLRRTILQVSAAAGEGHVPSSLSILDLLWVLYSKVLKGQGTADESRDRFVLSKGHASLALYAVLAEKGYFPPEELKSFCQYSSRLGGHPDCRKVPGVEASTGSLGHGFPMAVGMAMGAKIRRLDTKVYCIVGDGECNEGSVWEGALLAAHHRLDNLCCIVDQNHSSDRALTLGNLGEKFKSFGWKTTMIDGHDLAQIDAALNDPHPDQPLAVIAETIKGKGIGAMENNPAWHHRTPTSQELQEFLEVLS